MGGVHHAAHQGSPVRQARTRHQLPCYGQFYLLEETDLNRIQTVFDAVALHTQSTNEKVKYAPYNMAASMHLYRIAIEVIPEELTQLLRLAEKALNPDTLRQCISFRAASIPNAIVPAFSSFRHCSIFDKPRQFSENVFECAAMLKEEVQAWLPSETSWKLDGVPLPSDLCFDRQCRGCKAVEDFLADEEERRLTLWISSTSRSCQAVSRALCQGIHMVRNLRVRKNVWSEALPSSK